MDKVKHYKSVVFKVLDGLVKDYYNRAGPIEARIVADTNNGHFMIFLEGWQDQRFIYGTSIHVEVKESGRVYVHRDSSSVIIIDHLEKAGIPTSDMVVSWHPPIARKHTEFAEV